MPMLGSAGPGPGELDGGGAGKDPQRVLPNNILGWEVSVGARMPGRGKVSVCWVERVSVTERGKSGCVTVSRGERVSVSG